MSRFCSKSAGFKMRRKLYVAVLTTLSGSAYAVPEGGKVVVGAADLIRNGDTLTIEQSTQRAVLEFDRFDVGAHETVNFVQPASDSVALNRVLGSDLSTIHGSINANGHIYLINPNGVLFGAGAQVNVGGLVATTLDMSNQDFINQREHLQGATQGQVENRGQINATGRVALVAADVINSGDISAPGGEVMLRSSRNMLLHAPGSEIPILMEDPQLSGQVINEGTLSGGRVAMVLDGQGSRDVYDNAINNSGIVRAVTATGKGGSVELMAAGGDVVHSGEIDVSAEQGDGGKVVVRAQRYGQRGIIEASGKERGNGGDISIVADQAIAMDSRSETRANGAARGNGGEVILYADKDTWFPQGAKISARGGDVAGDGGFVEVSGKEFIDVHGSVDVGAASGEGGLWYIDPTDIEIVTGNSTAGMFVGPDPFNWDSTGVTSIAQIGTLAVRAALENGSVIINTASDQPETGHINVRTWINFNDLPDGRTLSLIADGDITFQGDSGVRDASPGGDELSVELRAGGNIMFNGGSSVDVGTGVFTASADGFISITNITSASTSGQAIVLESLNGELRATNVGASVAAANGGAVLGAATGINLFEYVTSQGLGLRHYGTAPFSYEHSGDLVLTSVGLGANAIFNIKATGSITYTGTGGGDLDGATDASLSLEAGTGLAINGDLADITGAVDNSTTLNFIAGTDFSMADGVTVNAGGGLIDINAVGDAQVGGLISSSVAADAVRISTGGALLGAAVNSVAVRAARGGLVVDAAAGVANLETQVDRVDITAGIGDIHFTEVDEVEVVRLRTPDAVEVTTGGDFILPSTADWSASQLSVNAGGTIVLPDAGISVTSGLNLVGSDVVTETAGGVLNLTAASVALISGTMSGDSTVNATADTLAVANNGANNISVSSSSRFLSVFNNGAGELSVANDGALTLVSAAPNSGTTTVRTAESFNLTIADANTINMNDASGSLVLDSGDDLLVNVDIVDETGAVDGSPNLQLSARNDVIFDSSILVDVGAGNLAISAANGNVTLGRVAGESVSLEAGLAIVDANADASVANITAAQVELVAGGDIGTLLNPLRGDVTSAVVDGGNVHFSNARSVSLGVSRAADMTIALPNAGDLTLLDTGSAITGSVQLDIDAGDLILADGGLSLEGDLAISASTLRAGNGAPSLQAANATIGLAADGTDTALDVDFDTLVLQVAGTQTVAINDSDELAVTSVATAGDLSLSTSGDLSISDAAAAFANNLTLSAAGNLSVAEGILSVGDTLALTALDISDGDRIIDIAANRATVNLQPNAALTLATAVADLEFTSVGTHSVAINEADGLNVTTLSAAGDLSLNALAGDITFGTEVIDVAGTASLATAGMGRIVLTETGLNSTGDLTLDAAAITDTDTSVNLAADTLTIRQRAGDADSVFNTTARSLTLNHAGTGTATVNQGSDLRLLGLTASGNVNVNVLNNLIFSESVPDIGGDLSLTVGGVLTIADPGLSLSRALALDAGSVATSSAAGATAWQADSISMRIRNSAQSDGVNLDANQVSLHYEGDAPVAVAVQDGAAITGVTARSGITINSAGELYVLAESSVVDGLLTLNANGALTVLHSGLTVADAVDIRAADLRSSNGGAVSLRGNRANIVLTGDAPLSLSTMLAQLSMDYASAADLSVTNEGPLTIAHWQVPRATDVGLSVTGTLTVPATGLSAPGQFHIHALDLVDTDRSLDLSAQQLLVRLTGSSGDNVWRFAGEQLDAQVNGTANLHVVAAEGLALQDLNGDGQAIAVDNGNFSVVLSSGDLRVNSNVSASDHSADGLRAGVVDLHARAGDITVGAGSDVSIVSVNNVDPGAASVAGGENGIRLQLGDTSSAQRRIMLGDGASKVVVRAVGGDILLDARPPSTPTAAQRRVVQNAGTRIAAYNNMSDAQTGRVLLNGAEQQAKSWQTIQQGRTLAFIADEDVGPDLGGVMGEVDNIEEGLVSKGEPQKQNADASEQFEKVFGRCDEVDKNSSQRCRVDAALKAFLSHWLVGGEMPPKSEI